MFKPGTLVKLAAGYNNHVGVILANGLNFWFDKNHIGLMVKEHENRLYSYILVEDQVIVMPTRALQKY